MNPEEFLKSLNEIQDFMEKENYSEAIVLIEKLKKVEKDQSYNYSLTHRLYQLDSNSRSLFNQQKILSVLKDLANERDTITFLNLNDVLKDKVELNLNEDVLRREIELLILRNLLPCKINGNNIILKS